MTRPLRIDYSGAVHHVTARGNEKRSIFLDQADHRRFLDRLHEMVRRHNIVVHAYCLMGNHYHVLAETPDGNLSRAMQGLNGRYAIDFNRRHARVGHLFQGRFASRLIERERYLVAVCRYVLLNPVRAGLVKHPGQWRWSSYLATAGAAPPEPFVTTDWLLGRFHPSDRREAMRGFRVFIEAGTSAGGGLPAGWSERAILGDRPFIERFRPLLRDKIDIREFARKDRFASRPPLDELLVAEGRAARNDQLKRAIFEYGYRSREIARFLGLHESTISKILNAGRQDSRCDP